MTLFEFDRQEGIDLLCGVDEAGRGPLAGDVYAAAVILPPDLVIDGLNDSKKLSPKKRDALYDIICKEAVSFHVATASVAEIETYNILQATFLAMRRAVEGLTVTPKLVLVDGNQNPRLPVHSRTVVKGDATSACIAAASILAKVERDRYMEELDRQYPEYQFARHKGYGTALHYQMLEQYGPSPVHRLSFLKKKHPVKKAPSAGALGETATAEYLMRNGYAVTARNYHCRYGEIDLIAQKDGVTVFVEVKTRAPGSMTLPKEAVTAAKRRKLVNAALCYIQQEKLRCRMRFDVAEVYLQPDTQTINSVHLIENAFDGGKELAYF